MEWKTDDEEHPWNWSEKSKWLGLCVAILFNSSTAVSTSVASGQQDVWCTILIFRPGPACSDECSRIPNNRDSRI